MAEEAPGQAGPAAVKQPDEESLGGYILQHIPSNLERRFRSSILGVPEQPINKMHLQLIVLNRITRLRDFYTDFDFDYNTLNENLDDNTPQVQNQIRTQLFPLRLRIDLLETQIIDLELSAQTQNLNQLTQILNRTEEMCVTIFRIKAELTKFDVNRSIAENREIARYWNNTHPQHPLPRPKMIDFEPNIKGVAMTLDRLIIEVFQMREGLLRRMNNAFRRMMPFKMHPRGINAIQTLNTVKQRLQDAYTNLVKVIDLLNALSNESLFLIESLNTVAKIGDLVFVLYTQVVNLEDDADLWTLGAKKDPNRLQIAWQQIQDERKREAEESWPTSPSQKQRKQ